MESERKEFSDLCTQFLFLNHYDEAAEVSIIELNLVLNELNAICFRHQQIADPKYAGALMAAFPKIPSKEDTLVVKACCLMVSLVKKQNIRIPPHIANANIVWLLRCLEGNFHAVIHEAVKAFSALLLNNVNTLEIPYERFFSGDRGLFTKLLKNPKIVNNPDVKYEKNSEEEIFLSTLTCVDTILSGYAEVEAVTKIPNEYLTNIGEIILRNIYRWELMTLGEVNYATFIYRSLNILKILTDLQDVWIVENLGEILGAARAFTMTGYVDGDWMKPRRVAPSQQILVEPQNQTTSKGGKVIRAKKGKKLSKSSQKSGKKNKNPKNEDHSQFIKPYSYESTIENAFGDSSEEQTAFQTSESELSDSGGGKVSHDLRQKKYRVRLAAIQLIGVLAKAVDRKTMFGYWHCLFAPNDAEPASVTLDGCILHDPSHRCRIAALQTISYLLHDAKKFLYQAESVDRESASFTPFSVALGKMVVQLYQALLQALNTESLTPLIVQILKCFNILIPATPFHRLKSGIITKLVEKIRKLIHHWDATVKLHAFRVMGYIISITDITPEIMTCIGVEQLTVRTENIHRKYLEDVGNEEDYDESVEVEADAEEATEQERSVNELGEKRMAWILEDLLSCISAGKERQRTPQVLEIHTECLTLLAAMSAHIGIMLGHLMPIAQAIRTGLESDASAIVVNSAKALDFIAHSITQYFLNASTVKATGELEDALMLWTVTLPAVTEHLQGTVTNVKVICCDALSNIGGHVYEKLPRDKQFLILSLLHGNTSNNETIVRASACRALSVLAQFPSLRDDLVFLENTAEMVTDLIPMGDELSRMKAAWALGNITDIHHLKSDSPFDRLRDDLLEKMLRTAVAACDDQYKVRCNIVRAIGNLLYLIREDLLVQESWQELVGKVIECLVVNARDVKFMKVRWNACYAMGNMMRNICFYTEAAQRRLNWQTLIFPALCELVVNNPNFKVRINATVALASVPQRDGYGQHFASIWSALILALEHAVNLTDFNEYKHRDNLMDQLCLTLAHFIICTQTTDLVAMQQELLPHVEVTRENWSRVANRILPERATPLLLATQKLKNFAEEKLTPDQQLASNFLASCFISPVEYA